ncbi:hypothetical protein IFM89_013165 [Coptis chinensis]|uniref:Uncharacterized protein n=1 Tax=Coptis chinensis TaxID=261450 RepID=A0A835IDR7_9MAGN|nr:hypothetical protein IFM89_013165 [Coptis chinensis]
MGRAPCCDKANVKRGPWSPEEDFALKNYVERHGTGGNWISLPQKAVFLLFCGFYLKKNGSRVSVNQARNLSKARTNVWSVIASQLQGRTDNDVKNYWNTKLKKKILAGKITLNGEKMLTSNNHLQPSSSSSLAMHNASQNDNKCFSSYLIQNSTTVPMSMNVNVGSSRLLPNSVKLTFPGLVDSPEFSVASANNPNVSSSSSSDVPSLPIPLAVPLDNNYSSWWSGNGSDEDDRFLWSLDLVLPMIFSMAFVFKKEPVVQLLQALLIILFLRIS